ncbi:hypothetical protein ACFU96_48260 [Streptomyces sp. NPDC057620]|uniref:hypothetical protein n=1 Tax=Streptomyces sp. NPDC057620 TaxID=3346185 RepID=UPI0036921835
MTDQPPRLFVLWLDASDGSVPTHDGVVWPDGTTTLHHRHFGHTTTHHSVDAARQLTYGKQGRIEWPQPETTGSPVESPPDTHATQPSLSSPPRRKEVA